MFIDFVLLLMHRLHICVISNFDVTFITIFEANIIGKLDVKA